MGINAEGLGRDHWNEMLAYPRKPIAHWHSLVEVKKSFKEVGEVALGLGMFAAWQRGLENGSRLLRDLAFMGPCGVGGRGGTRFSGRV